MYKRQPKYKERLIIKCSPELKRRFRAFALDFKNYEEALKFLLSYYKGVKVETFESKK